jgi:type II secretory pathway component GspD/PulD (secretin)
MKRSHRDYGKQHCIRIMNMKLAFLLLLALGLAGALSWAQSQNPAPPAPVDGAVAPKPASTASDSQPAESPPAPVVAAPAAAATVVAPAVAPVVAPAGTPNEPAPSAEQSSLVPIPAAAKDAAAHKPDAPDNRGPLTLEQELPAAVQFLAKMASLNIQFDPSLTFTNAVAGPDGKIPPVPIVSLRWENVTAEDALQEVLDNHGLMLVINPKTGIGRVTRKPTMLPLTTALVQLRHTSPTNILEVVKSTFVDPRSKVTADMRTSQLVIVTNEREMYAVTNLITQLDTPTKQVLIEARLLETAKNPTSVKGIDWSGTLQGQNFSFGNGITSGSTTTRTPGDISSSALPSGRTVDTTAGSSVASTLLTTLGNGGISANTARGFNPATAFLNADGVHAVLSFLNSENDTEVVATPRAVTADNQMAILSVTRAFPIFQVTPGSANVAAAAQVQYTNLGTILKVTPRITANSNVALKVIPEVSNIDSKDRQIINGSVNEANVYAIRRMEADVVIPSGSTLVMGGLLSDSSTKSYSKVPILGDLPGIGMAFRRDSKSRNKANLLIFVTPTIIQDEDFRPTASTFLQTPIPNKPDPDESAWNSGKPYSWRKGSQN